MAFVNPKEWLGTTGDLSLVTNWQQDNVRTAAFSWTVSGSGTNEYYLRTAANASPGFVSQPAAVYINGSSATEGTVGSLSAGQWDYGDNDTLGYNTIYVRLSDGANPNTKAAGFVKFNQVPQTGENVIIPASSGAISSNTDYSATTLGTVTVEKSTANRAHGSATSPIRLKCTGFIFDGGGQTSAYYDLTDSAILAEIRGTASVAAGLYGLYLAGTAVTIADLQGGSVGLGVLPGQPFTCTTAVRTRGSSVRAAIGSACTVPLLEALAGSIEHENSIANIEVDGGEVRSRRASAVSGAVTVAAGTWYDQSSGTKASVVQNGGTIDATQGGGNRTWSAYAPNAGTFRDDPDSLTVSSITRPTTGSHTWIR
jgi:hypothetical protein